MDIHEKQSLAPEGRWRGFQFSTLVVCVLGILGNVSSLLVLGRHLKEIAGSRLLLALAVADLGVVTSVTSRTVSYVTYGNNWLTKVLDWWFLYCYYCSIYVIVLLSIDRYLHTAKSMLLRRINYNHILKRAILAVFAVMLIITLPHLLGSFVKYHHGSHTARANYCPGRNVCSSTPIPAPRHGFTFCDQRRNTTSLSSSDQKIYIRLTTQLCDLERKHNYTANECSGQLVTVPATKYSPSITVFYQFHSMSTRCRIGFRNDMRFPCSFGDKLVYTKSIFCLVGQSAMRHDPDFVKAVYLGLDLPLRYVIPCLSLIVINIMLVVTVRKAQRRHSDISQTASKSLLDMPVLRSAVSIVFVFLICHTGGAGLFVLDVIRAFGEHNTGFIGTTVNAFIKESMATKGLETKYAALLLAAVNSSVNIVLYCLFLPTFRNRWALLLIRSQRDRIKATPREPTADIIPLEQISQHGSVS